MTTLQDYTTPYFPNFCPGCGNISIWAAFKQAAVKANWSIENTVICAGIGCHGHMLNFVKLNTFTSLHGRGLPLATGIKMANHNLNVFVFTGDGDCLAEGGNHFIHTCRRNHNLTIILHDNAVYGLTTGQTSPASPHGFVSKSTPEGNKDEPLYPPVMALAAGATFVARAYSGHMPQLVDILIKANDHQGISLVDVLQPCVTFNKNYTHEFFQQNTYYVDETYDKTDKLQAIQKALQWGEKQIALGVLYQIEKPSYEAQLPQLSKSPLVAKQPEKRDINNLLKKYM